MDHKFQARHIAVGGEEDGWVVFGIFGYCDEIRYDNGEVYIPEEPLRLDSQDVNLDTVELIGVDLFRHKFYG